MDILFLRAVVKSAYRYQKENWSYDVSVDLNTVKEIKDLLFFLWCQWQMLFYHNILNNCYYYFLILYFCHLFGRQCLDIMKKKVFLVKEPKIESAHFFKQIWVNLSNYDTIHFAIVHLYNPYTDLAISYFVLEFFNPQNYP